jgi:phosphatidylglycerophosphate synthase
LDKQPDRRPLKSRSTAWARGLAGALVRARVHPDAISLASLVFAGIGAALLATWPTSLGLVGTACCVQLRLLCNLLDGMVAIEGGRKSALGGLYNELPDRVADSAFLVALGCSIGEPWLGWLGALAAAVTAYIRVLGGTFGLAQDFRGPMAKPHRMAVLTAGCLAGSVELSMGGDDVALTAAAWVIAVGALLTCVTRTLAIARKLRAGAAP